MILPRPAKQAPITHAFYAVDFENPAILVSLIGCPSGSYGTAITGLPVRAKESKEIDDQEGMWFRNKNFILLHPMTNPLGSVQQYLEGLEAELRSLKDALRVKDVVPPPVPADSESATLGGHSVMQSTGDMGTFTLSICRAYTLN